MGSGCAGGIKMNNSTDEKKVSKEGLEFLNSLSKKEIELLRQSIEFQTTIMRGARVIKWCILFVTSSLIAFWQIIDHIDKIRKFFTERL